MIRTESPSFAKPAVYPLFVYNRNEPYLISTNTATKMAASVGTWTFSLPATKSCVSRLSAGKAVSESIVEAVAGICKQFKIIYVRCLCV